MRRQCRGCGKRPASFIYRDKHGITHFARGHAHDLCRQCWSSLVASQRARLRLDRNYRRTLLGAHPRVDTLAPGQ